MIQITPQMRVLVAVEAADFRRGIDGLARQCREVLRQDPFSGTVFVFRNRRASSVKLLIYDGQGFWLCHKRLSEGHFRDLLGMLGNSRGHWVSGGTTGDRWRVVGAAAPARPGRAGLAGALRPAALPTGHGA